ncbi:MAG: hypothetical protein H7A34_09485 [bacterium]|nr:hypothetical protein [bacterium]
MRSRDQWLKELRPGNLVIESTATAQRTVRIVQITTNKIYYAGFYSETDLEAFVWLATGASSAYDRHILPVSPEYPMVTPI